MDEETFAFGSFRLIPAQRMLLDDGKSLRLGSRAFDILVTLVESAGETIRKDLLIARIWPDTVVDEGALRVHVAALRKALGDGRAGKRYIANIPSRGYSFIAPVTREQQRQPAIAPTNGSAVRGNLPAPLTRIVGRDDIIAALAAQLAQRAFSDHRRSRRDRQNDRRGRGRRERERVIRGRHLVRRAGLAARSGPGGEHPQHRAWTVSAGRQPDIGIGRMAPGQACPDRARQLRTRDRRGGGNRRGDPQSSGPRLHSGHQPGAIAGRGRMAAPPPVAGVAASLR